MRDVSGGVVGSDVAGLYICAGSSGLVWESTQDRERVEPRGGRRE